MPLDQHIEGGHGEREPCLKIHIPSDLVVNRWASDVESSSHRDFLGLHSVWTTCGRLIRDKITSAISISWVRFLEACFGFFSGVIVAGMSDSRHKRHNVSSLIDPIVCPATYRRVIFDAEVDTVRKDVCFDIAKRYAIAF